MLLGGGGGGGARRPAAPGAGDSLGAFLVAGHKYFYYSIRV